MECRRLLFRSEDAVKYSVIHSRESFIEDLDRAIAEDPSIPQTLEIAGELYNVVGTGIDYIVIERYKKP